MEIPKKILIILDFDSTITEGESFSSTIHVVNDKKVENEILSRVIKENWVDVYNWFYDYLQKLKIPMSKIDSAYEQLPLTKGMIELFSYLRENRDKYEVIIISGGHSYGINYIMKYNNLIDVIDDILCNPIIIDENGKILVQQRYSHSCNFCNPCQCKTIEFEGFMKKKGDDYYSKKIYICDGGNDICLAQNLGENDYVFPRKGFRLYRKLFDEDMKEKMKCKIKPWSNGNEIIELLKII